VSSVAKDLLFVKVTEKSTQLVNRRLQSHSSFFGPVQRNVTLVKMTLK